MAATPSFAATPRHGMAKLNAADTNMDAPTTTFTVLTGGANGTRVDRVIIKQCGTFGVLTSANVVRLFLNDGTNKRLLKEVAFSAVTTSTSVLAPETQVHFPEGLLLPSASYSLMATEHVHAGAQDDYMVHAFGADL